MQIETARRQHEALREIIIHHQGGWRDEPALHRVRDLCRAASGGLDDREAQQRISAVEAYAAELFSESGHLRWAHKQMSGAALLRLQILRELDGLLSRLNTVEALQNLSLDQGAQPGRHEPL